MTATPGHTVAKLAVTTNRLSETTIRGGVRAPQVTLRSTRGLPQTAYLRHAAAVASLRKVTATSDAAKVTRKVAATSDAAAVTRKVAAERDAARVTAGRDAAKVTRKVAAEHDAATVTRKMAAGRDAARVAAGRAGGTPVVVNPGWSEAQPGAGTNSKVASERRFVVKT